MKRNQALFPLRYGRGTQKVSLYAPTTALLYYRLAYQMGGKRLQRTYKSFEKAKEAEKRPLSPEEAREKRLLEHWAKFWHWTPRLEGIKEQAEQVEMNREMELRRGF